MVVHAEFETFPAKAGRSPRENLVISTGSFGVDMPGFDVTFGDPAWKHVQDEVLTPSDR